MENNTSSLNLTGLFEREQKSLAVAFHWTLAVPASPKILRSFLFQISCSSVKRQLPSGDVGPKIVHRKRNKSVHRTVALFMVLQLIKQISIQT